MGLIFDVASPAGLMAILLLVFVAASLLFGLSVVFDVTGNYVAGMKPQESRDLLDMSARLSETGFFMIFVIGGVLAVYFMTKRMYYTE